MLTKQAKMLTADQITMVEQHITTRQDCTRDLTILYLSVYAGLRACEVAALDWSMLVGSDGAAGYDSPHQRCF